MIKTITFSAPEKSTKINFFEINPLNINSYSIQKIVIYSSAAFSGEIGCHINTETQMISFSSDDFTPSDDVYDHQFTAGFTLVNTLNNDIISSKTIFKDRVINYTSSMLSYGCLKTFDDNHPDDIQLKIHLIDA